MTSIVGKKRGYQTYYYLVESARVDGKPRIVDQQYLGRAAEVMARLAGAPQGSPARTQHKKFGDLAAVWGILGRPKVIETIDEVCGPRRADAAASVGTSAAVHVAVMEPGRGPRRYLCGRRMTAFDEVLDLLHAAAGRRIRRVRIPKQLLGIGRASDLVSRVVPVAPLLSYEAAWLLTSPTPTDDRRTHDELGVGWRPLEETIRAAIGT